MSDSSTPNNKNKTPTPNRPKLQTPAPKKRTPIKRKPENAKAIQSVPQPEKKPKPALPSTYQQILHGAIWVLVLGLGGYVFLALVSYQITDPSFLRGIPSSAPVANRAGLLGAYLADVGYHGLGLSIWWLVAGAFVWLYRNFRLFNQQFNTDSPHSGLLFGIGLGMILFSSPMVERLLLLGKLNNIFIKDAGGWVGELTTHAFTMYLGEGGSLFILMILLAVGIKLLVQFSYLDLGNQLWQKFKQGYNDMMERQSHQDPNIAPSRAIIIKPWKQWRDKWSSGSGSLKPNFTQWFQKNTPNHTKKNTKKNTAENPNPNNPPTETAHLPLPKPLPKPKGKNRKNHNKIKLSDHSESEQVENPATVAISVPSASEADGAESHTSGYRLPPVNLLQANKHTERKPSAEELAKTAKTIQEKLAEFGIKVDFDENIAIAGPVITRYEITPHKGVKGRQIHNLSRDLARSMAVDSVRVVESISGKNSMGIEVPNKTRYDVVLHDILHGHFFQSQTSKLTVALGQDVGGTTQLSDLAKMPHILVAGMTGSGKSVGVNAMIMSILFKAKPNEVRFIMIDPKMLELSVYDGIAHLLCPVVTDMREAGHALNWCIAEMEKRYRLMSHLGVRNIDSYNEKIQAALKQNTPITNPFSLNPDSPEPLDLLPKIVIVIDELADLMMTERKTVEIQITRLAQKARAAGMHMIIATQRPSVDVMTGVIKANIPTRLAFTVQNKFDSRTILDDLGAESLLKNGDSLFLVPGSSTPVRLQGAFVSDDEVHRVVDFIKKQAEPNYIDGILSGEAILENKQFLPKDLLNQNHEHQDELFDKAVEYILSTRKTSISALQRGLHIGYNRAATLMELLEKEGVVSPTATNGTRQILVKKDEI